MESSFKSSITRGGSILRPDVIIINDETKTLTYKKRDPILFTADTKTIDVKHITDVSIDRHIWGSDVQIITPIEIITCKRFTYSDAKAIRDMVFDMKRTFL